MLILRFKVKTGGRAELKIRKMKRRPARETSCEVLHRLQNYCRLFTPLRLHLPHVPQRTNRTLKDVDTECSGGGRSADVNQEGASKRHMMSQHWM